MYSSAAGSQLEGIFLICFDLYKLIIIIIIAVSCLNVALVTVTVIAGEETTGSV